MGLPSATTCYYCNLEHEKVEGGGVWHCPNNLCRGPGAAHFRSKLDSYVTKGERHTVDPMEWVTRALAELPEDPVVAAAIKKSARAALGEEVKP